MEDSFGCMKCDLCAAFFITVEFQSMNQPFELYSFASSLSVASSSSRLLQIRRQAPHSIVVMMMIIIRHRSLNYYYYYNCPPCFSLSSFHHPTLPLPTHGRFGLLSSCNINPISPFIALVVVVLHLVVLPLFFVSWLFLLLLLFQLNCYYY
jgi:hypothetical protein